MIIKYIRDIKCPFEGNNKRISEIRKAIDTFDFNKFADILTAKDKVSLVECLQNEMFFEVVNDSVVEKLLNTFINTDKKYSMLNDLGVSYTNRGAKGMFLCWHGVINKYRDDQVK